MTGFDFQKVLGMDTSINTTKIYFPDLEDVLPNELNYYSKSEDRISELADEIASDGLREPCVAYLDEDENYILLSGETRYRSCMKLVRQGRSYSFHGKDITGKIPIALDHKPENIHYERLAITGSNNKRNSLTNNEKAEMIKNTVDDLNALAESNEFTWTGKKTWEVVAAKTGLSGHYVRDYLSGKMTRDRRIIESNVDSDKKEAVASDLQKDFKKALRTFRNADKMINFAALLGAVESGRIEQFELMIATRVLYEDLSRLICGIQLDNTWCDIFDKLITSDTELAFFAKKGDPEAVIELLKNRNGLAVDLAGKQILVQNNKVYFEYLSDKPDVMPMGRFVKMLIDYSKSKYE